MDPMFPNLGFTASYSLKSFKNLGDSIRLGAGGGEREVDTVLRLDSPASECSEFPAPRGVKRKWNLVDGSLDQQVGSSPSLGLGRLSSPPDSKGSLATVCTMSSAKENNDSSLLDPKLDFALHLGNERTPTSKRVVSSSSFIKTLELQPKVDLELSLSTGPSNSDITSIHQNVLPLAVGGFQNAEEAINSLNRDASFVLNQVTPGKIDLGSVSANAKQSSSVTTPKSSVTCTSSTAPNKPRSSSSKTCRVEGCGKGARGASGRCISHGGGRRCRRPGCNKGAEGQTAYCKAHGGGCRCQFLGCTKSAEGRTDFCIAHGGGHRCSYQGGCIRAARGKSGLCIRHGGGKRCQKVGCTRSAEGLSGLCISHGGGRRCLYAGCGKGAQGNTMFCKAHGGGKRCTYLGCTKGAEGSTLFCKGHGGGKRCSFPGVGVCPKSVHGGTNFCIAHGGGKRCAVPGCMKSARGRTDFCVRHGGGKRCKFESCGKSAQGSTDFCKAHGGGKRCLWGHPGSEQGTQATGPCNSFARGKTGLCAVHGGLVQDRRVHGGISVGPVVHGRTVKNVASEKMSIDISGASSSRSRSDLKQHGSNCSRFSAEEGSPSASMVATEGRVHGGSLMAMVADRQTRGPGSRERLFYDPSDTEKSKYPEKSQN